MTHPKRTCPTWSPGTSKGRCPTGYRRQSERTCPTLHVWQLHREEAIEQPGVEQADADEHEERAVALDELQVLEQRRQAEADDPRIEAHTDAAERLRPNALDEDAPIGTPIEDARQDVGNEREALDRDTGRRSSRRPP